MSNDLTRLVYYSRNRVSGGVPALSGEITSILAASRKNNERQNVTGALMFNGGCFGQVLEGSRAAVEDTFERIQQDPRHGEVSLLACEPAGSRAFQHWSMGFVGVSIEDASRYRSIVQDTGFDLSAMTGDALFEALHRLALEEEGFVGA